MENYRLWDSQSTRFKKTLRIPRKLFSFLRIRDVEVLREKLRIFVSRIYNRKLWDLKFSIGWIDSQSSVRINHVSSCYKVKIFRNFIVTCCWSRRNFSIPRRFLHSLLDQKRFQIITGPTIRNVSNKSDFPPFKYFQKSSNCNYLVIYTDKPIAYRSDVQPISIGRHLLSTCVGSD